MYFFQSVLVETQDKALRRISELREQCSLEQQAKAHLESALRLEMDEMQCVIQTLTTKLKLLGESSENASLHKDNLIQLDNQQTAAISLINLNEDDVTNGNDLNRLKKQLDDANKRISEMSFREEENTILLAENKMMIHSELENKEREVRTLEQKLASLETTLQQSDGEKKKIRDMIAQMKQENQSLTNRISEAIDSNRVLEQRIIQMEASKKELEAKVIIVESEKETLQTKNNQELQKFKHEYNELQRKNEELETISNNKAKEAQGKLESELKHIKEAHADISRQFNETQSVRRSLETEVGELRTRIEQQQLEVKTITEKLQQTDSDKGKLEQRLKQIFDEKQHVIGEFEIVKSQNSKLQSNLDDLQQKLDTKDSAESCAVQSETVHLKEQLKDALNEAADCHHAIKLLEDRLNDSGREKEDLTADATNLKSKIDSLRTEKRDLEKTLEKEIRDKTELKTQVTNILQEIGRLEEQLTEVKHSYAEIEKEKRALEQRSAIDTARSASDSTVDKLKEFEHKLQEVQCENTQLSEKNCQLEECNGRLQITATENEISLTSACARAQDLEVELSALRLEYDSSRETVEKLQEKLRQCLDENSRLLNAKEMLDHEYRSLQDQCEERDKEKLCVLDSNQCLEAELAKLRDSSNCAIALEREKNNLAETCDRMHADLDVLQVENADLKRIRDETQAKLVQLAADINVANENKNIAEIALHELRSAHSETNKSLVDDCDAMLDEVQKLRKENQQYLSELTTASKERASVEKRLTAEVAELKSLNTQYLSHLKEATDESQHLKKELNKTGDAIKKLEALEQVKIENEYLTTSAKHMQADLSKITSERNNILQELQDANGRLKSQQCELYVLQEEKEKRAGSDQAKDSEIDQLKTVCQRAHALNEELQTEVRQQKEQVETLRSLSEDLQAAQSGTDTQMQSLKSTVAHAEQMNETYQNELRKQKQLNEEHQNESKARSAEFAALQTEMAETATEQQHLVTANASLSQEIESSRAIISDLNKDLEEQMEAVQNLQVHVEQNQKLQARVNELLAEQATAAVSKNGNKTDEMDALRRLNEAMKLELAEQKRISDGLLSNLNNEIDELNENARAYKEKANESESIRQRMSSLQSELNEFKKQSNTFEEVSIRDENVGTETLRQERDELDAKLKKIMHEVQDVSNRNMFLEQQCENYLIVEQSNERLKLQNEKLSRQLDDTLVRLICENLFTYFLFFQSS